MRLVGNCVDVVGREIVPVELFISNGRISDICQFDGETDVFFLPGMVDSHVHIESSMLCPQEFARLAVRQGTVSVVADPHEIANVCGRIGVEYMIEDASRSLFKFYFGVPSCVPTTRFETSGAVLGIEDVAELITKDEVVCLSEVMNYPAVLRDDPYLNEILLLAKRNNKPIDGHAPGLNGFDLVKYVDAGIQTDHECATKEDGINKLLNGMKVQIREGSAAKNFDALVDLLKYSPKQLMFCTDDCHPDDLAERHIINLIKRGVALGYDLFDLLTAATINPIRHYGLNVGLLQPGDLADFIVVDNLKDFTIQQTYIDGQLVYDKGSVLLEHTPTKAINNFNCNRISEQDISLKDCGKDIKVITVKDGQLTTGIKLVKPKVVNGEIVSDLDKDILKIVVKNRYTDSVPIVGFIENFGLKRGAFGGSIAHDSHNIIALGSNNSDLVAVVNQIINSKGGIVAINGADIHELSLPIGGLMTNVNGFEVAEKYKQMDDKVKEWGSTLTSPFMTLSFMALLVIPELKISDKGLFDGRNFEFTSLFV